MHDTHEGSDIMGYTHTCYARTLHEFDEFLKCKGNFLAHINAGNGVA